MAYVASIHMGFLNTPYNKKSLRAPVAAAKAAEAKRQHRGFTRNMTATDVGRILEDKYNIVEIFAEIYQQEIIDLVTDKLGDVIVGSLSDKVRNTGDKLVTRMKGRTRQIDKMFRDFLDMDQMNGIVEDKAAKKRGTPYFVKTGIYKASFRSWIEK